MREEDRGVGGNSVRPHDLTSFVATLTVRCFPIWITDSGARLSN